MNAAVIFVVVLVAGGGFGYVGYHDGAIAATPIHELTADDVNTTVRTRGVVVLTSDIFINFEAAYGNAKISKEVFFEGGTWCVIRSQNDDETVKALAIVNYDESDPEPVKDQAYVVTGELVYYTSLTISGTTYKLAYIDADEYHEPWLFR